MTLELEFADSSNSDELELESADSRHSDRLELEFCSSSSSKLLELEKTAVSWVLIMMLMLMTGCVRQ